MSTINGESKKNIKTIKIEKELTSILNEVGKSHKYYNFYAPEYKIKYIIDSCALYLSDGQKWNDTIDRQNMKKNSFALCFSCSIFESVAMWMLYGGIDKKGALIKFPNSLINDICQSIKDSDLSFGHFEEQIFVEEPINSDQFKKKFDAYLVDIGYCRNKTIFTLGGKIKFEKEEKVKEKLENTKSYPWKYERECRLIVSTYPKDLNLFASKRIDTLRIKLSNKTLKKLQERIVLSPVHPNKSENSLSKLQPNLSKMDGKIDWDLCPHKCKYK